MEFSDLPEITKKIRDNMGQLTPAPCLLVVAPQVVAGGGQQGSTVALKQSIGWFVSRKHIQNHPKNDSKRPKSKSPDLHLVGHQDSLTIHLKRIKLPRVVFVMGKDQKTSNGGVSNACIVGAKPGYPPWNNQITSNNWTFLAIFSRSDHSSPFCDDRNDYFKSTKPRSSRLSALV